jgi:hypothetical protein
MQSILYLLLILPLLPPFAAPYAITFQTDNIQCYSGATRVDPLVNTYNPDIKLDFICKTIGETIVGNNIWLKTQDKCYISDYYIHNKDYSLPCCTPAKPSCGSETPSNFTLKLSDTDIASLEYTFNAILSIPDEVLQAGDIATDKWLVDNGYKPVGGQITPMGFWKCATAIIAVIGQNLVAATKLLKMKKYIEALGGFSKAAKLLLKASTWEERLRIGGHALVGLTAEISGIPMIVNSCT